MAYDPDKELVCLRKLLELGHWTTTKKLDAVMEEVWGEEHGLACNSMMRRGLIDYHCDGDWSIDFTEEDLKEWESESEVPPPKSFGYCQLCREKEIELAYPVLGVTEKQHEEAVELAGCKHPAFYEV